MRYLYVCPSCQKAFSDESAVPLTMKTCPNCKIAAALLDKAGIPYEKLYVEDNGQKAKDLGLKQAPALLVTKEGKTDRYLNVSEIKRYLGA